MYQKKKKKTEFPKYIRASLIKIIKFIKWSKLNYNLKKNLLIMMNV